MARWRKWRTAWRKKLEFGIEDAEESMPEFYERRRSRLDMEVLEKSKFRERPTAIVWSGKAWALDTSIEHRNIK